MASLLNPLVLLRTIINFLSEALEGFLNLRFTIQPPKYRPLPAHIQRLAIPGPDGPLELLVCEPSRLNPKAHPIVFQHGGFGHASVWLEWMGYLHTHNYGGRVYALSVRGHGASYSPSSWFRMVWLTKHDDIARDLLAGIAAVKEREEGRDPVLVAHSAGGEMCQYVLAKEWARTPALGLVGHVPHYGIKVVFENWGRFDPGLYVRGFLHGQHPKSTLSTKRLMREAFFGLDYGMEMMEEFARWAGDYEVMRWPLVSMGGSKGGKAVWLDVKDIVGSIDTDKAGERVLVLVGSEDKLMVGTSDRCVAEYREALERVNPKATVRFVEIDRAGHHVQNDVQWEEAAEALLGWLNQI